VVERILFLNEENHYTIAEFRPEKARGSESSRPAAVTLVGAAARGAVRRDAARDG
jgi:exodeoxyribonuclease V alpha subunit